MQSARPVIVSSCPGPAGAALLVYACAARAETETSRCKRAQRHRLHTHTMGMSSARSARVPTCVGQVAPAHPRRFPFQTLAAHTCVSVFDSRRGSPFPTGLVSPGKAHTSLSNTKMWAHIFGGDKEFPNGPQGVTKLPEVSSWRLPRGMIVAYCKR